MPACRPVAAAVLICLLAGVAVPADAAELRHRTCLTKSEQRAAVADRRAISLSRAVDFAHKHGRHGDLLRAKLCRSGEGLAYELTLLARNGKVRPVTIDATTGRVMTGR